MMMMLLWIGSSRLFGAPLSWEEDWPPPLDNASPCLPLFACCWMREERSTRFSPGNKPMILIADEPMSLG